MAVPLQSEPGLAATSASRWAPPRWLPNAITVLRIALIPAFLAHAHWTVGAVQAGLSEWPHRALAGAALVAIGLSDVVDGFLARRYGLATPLGAVLDALADKLVQLAALLYFWRAGAPFLSIPGWFVGLILARDLVLASGTSLVRWKRGRVQVVHQAHGKLASLLLFLVLVGITLGLAEVLIPVALWLLAVLVSLSTLDYVLEGWRQWR